MQDLESFKGFWAKVLKGPSFCLTKSGLRACQVKRVARLKKHGSAALDSLLAVQKLSCSGMSLSTKLA